MNFKLFWVFSISHKIKCSKLKKKQKMKRIKDVVVMEDIRLSIDKVRIDFLRMRDRLKTESLWNEKAELRRRLENIRVNLEDLLQGSLDPSSKDTILRRLTEVFVLSDDLGKSYCFPGYNDSILVLATIENAKK